MDWETFCGICCLLSAVLGKEGRAGRPRGVRVWRRPDSQKAQKAPKERSPAVPVIN